MKRGIIVAVDGEKPKDLRHLQKLLNKDEPVNIVFRVWSNRDQYLYDFFEVEYERDEVTLMNAM